MKYQIKINESLSQCLLCLRKCKLQNGQIGYCLSRINDKGLIKQIGYGYTSGFAIDPIEKKPLYHFYPNSKTLSFGTFGCNMGCVFCQNHHISKAKFDNTKSVFATSEAVVETAIKYGCKSISFTYNDPIIFYEYAIEIAKIAHEKGLKTIAVTAGYIMPEPRKEFFSHIDAVNIDLKGFSDIFYKKFCNADMKNILDTIFYVANKTNCVLELTTLLIENENTSEEDLTKEFKWIKSELGENIPIHLSAFHPDYKLQSKDKTSLDTIIKAYNLAKSEGLNYVYSGNISNLETSTTYCPKCKSKLIERNIYNIKNLGLINNKCANCNTEIYGEF